MRTLFPSQGDFCATAEKDYAFHGFGNPDVYVTGLYGSMLLKLLAMARRGMDIRQNQHDRKSTPEEEYNVFWKEIVEDDAGNINKEQLMKELYDFSFMLREVPKVYMAISGNNLSYPTYYAETVIAQFEDFLNEERTQAVKDAIEDGEVVSCEKVDALYDVIAHGDDGHRAWLKEAIEKHFEIESARSDA